MLPGAEALVMSGPLTLGFEVDRLLVPDEIATYFEVRAEAPNIVEAGQQVVLRVRCVAPPVPEPRWYWLRRLWLRLTLRPAPPHFPGRVFEGALMGRSR